MNENERSLIRAIANNDIKGAIEYSKIILNGISSKKDQSFKEQMLSKLSRQMVNLPPAVQGLLIALDMENYPIGKVLIRESEQRITEKVLATYRASQRLSDLGFQYLPAVLLYGESGTGKTELAKYIAHKANLPFVYIQFSNLVSSYLGSTQSNIGKVFAYVRSNPCVLCFDEIDAIGMKRGDQNDVSEISRATIALMQELDATPNSVIIVGTTNRFDRLDKALVRRFPISHEVLRFTNQEAKELAERIFDYAGYIAPEKFSDWFNDSAITVADIVKKCTDAIIYRILEEEEKNNFGILS